MHELLQNGIGNAIIAVKMETVSRFLQPPAHSFFLFGPRGTGKTTWLKTVLPQAVFVNLLRPEVYRSFKARPERLIEVVAGNLDREIVVDEVQRVPELLEVVHHLIEQWPGTRFVLTGSSARKLKRSGVDLLAGRAVVRELHPFMAAELPSFDLERALLQGLLPLVVASGDPDDVLAAYSALYLEQEVQAEGLVRNVGAFARFLEVASFSHGSVINLSNIARESQINRKSVEGYIEILEDLLLAFRLPVFTRHATRQLTAHPKFYLFDAGVFRSIRPRGPLDRPEEIGGAALEGLVAQHLRAWIAYTGADHTLYYWRTRAGLEVDFVVYGAREFWAVEVKNSARVQNADLRGLRAFRADYPQARALMLYRGEETLRLHDVDVIPAADFLRGLRA